MYDKLKKYAEIKGIKTIHEEKELLKDSKKEKALKQSDYNELTEKIAKDLGYLK